jgi:hypothetical protein
LDADDELEPLNSDIKYLQESTSLEVLFSTKEKIVNPYGALGDGSIWPRGFPFDKVKDTASHQIVTPKMDINVLIQQVR